MDYIPANVKGFSRTKNGIVFVRTIVQAKIVKYNHDISVQLCLQRHYTLMLGFNSPFVLCLGFDDGQKIDDDTSGHSHV